ncbi:MAG: hypothetical protein V8Q80_02195 [Barnesiella intestinihominis]
MRPSRTANSNTSSVATIKGIKPTAQEVIVLTIGKSSNNTSGFSYINAMRIVAEKGEPKTDVPKGVIRVDVAGTVSSLLPATTNTITTLILQGDLNGLDIKTIRELPSLKYLDMLNSKIVSGGEAYCKRNENRRKCFSQRNVPEQYSDRNRYLTTRSC